MDLQAFQGTQYLYCIHKHSEKEKEIYHKGKFDWKAVPGLSGHYRTCLGKYTCIMIT